MFHAVRRWRDSMRLYKMLRPLSLQVARSRRSAECCVCVSGIVHKPSCELGCLHVWGSLLLFADCLPFVCFCPLSICCSLFLRTCSRLSGRAALRLLFLLGVSMYSTSHVRSVQHSKVCLCKLAFFFFFFFLSAPAIRFSAFKFFSSSSSLALPEEGRSEVSLAVLAASESRMLP